MGGREVDRSACTGSMAGGRAVVLRRRPKAVWPWVVRRRPRVEPTYPQPEIKTRTRRVYYHKLAFTGFGKRERCRRYFEFDRE